MMERIGLVDLQPDPFLNTVTLDRGFEPLVPEPVRHQAGKHDQKTHGGGASPVLGGTTFTADITDNATAKIITDAHQTPNPTVVAASLSQVENEIRNNSVETAAAIMPDGHIIMGSSGTADHSTFPTYVAQHAAVMTHNHPNETAFSRKDMANTLAPDWRTPEVRVATPKYDYSMKPTGVAPLLSGHTHADSHRSPFGGPEDIGTFGLMSDMTIASMSMTGDSGAISRRFWDTMAPIMGWQLTATPRTP